MKLPLLFFCLGFSPSTIIRAAAASPHPRDKCRTFAQNLQIPNTTLLLAEYHTNNTQFPLVDQVTSCGGPDELVNVTSNLCRLVLHTSTSPSSSAVQLEAWLPDPELWNHRFLATGNGGEGGCIDYPTIQNGAAFGFASMGTNAGHNGSVGFGFFLDQPGVLDDFGYRAVHVEAQVGKAVIGRYYGAKARTNYFTGCSTGGRQAFQAAMRFPEDFDGVLAGSPGVDWLHIVASKGILARRIGWPDVDSGAAYVREEQW
jgi:feruloyl esterase